MGSTVPVALEDSGAGRVWLTQLGGAEGPMHPPKSYGGGMGGVSGRGSSSYAGRVGAARQGDLERNQAVLVMEDGQWRLPMRFDAGQRQWYLPLSADPQLLTPATMPTQRTDRMTSGSVRVERGLIRFQTDRDGRRMVELSLDDADVREVLQAIAAQAGMKLDMADELQGELTVDIANVTSDLAIRMIAGAVAATVSLDGDTYTLGPAKPVAPK